MRSFFCDKPGARFLTGCNVTLHIMPKYVEYIVKLDHGYYGVVNLMPEGKDKVTLLCYWGNYFKRLLNIPNKEKVMAILAKHCPTLVDVLSSKGEVKFAQFNNSKSEGTGFVMQLEADFSRGLIQLLGRDNLQTEALKLLNVSLSVFWEIHDSCPLKGWVDGLNEI